MFMYIDLKRTGLGHNTTLRIRNRSCHGDLRGNTKILNFYSLTTEPVAIITIEKEG